MITIIGVYCIYNNNTSEHLQIFDNQLAIISGSCEQLVEENNDYVLLGDFNGDPYRNRYSFDKLLIEFIANKNLLYCYSAKSHDFTFSNSISNSCIDHIFMNKSSSTFNESCKIEYNINNTSDHNAIKLNLGIKKLITTSTLENEGLIDNNIMKKNKKILNWSSHAKDLYSFFVVDKFSKIKFNSLFKSDEI